MAVSRLDYKHRERIAAGMAAGAQFFTEIGARRIPIDSNEELPIKEWCELPIRYQVGTDQPYTLCTVEPRHWRRVRDEIRREMRGSKRRVA